MPVIGFGGMSVLDAAAVDGEDIPWRVDGATSGPQRGRSGLIALMERCLDSDPAKRPLLNDVQTMLRAIPQ